MTVGVAVVAVVFFGASFRSTYLVLRGAQVGPTDHVTELRSLRPLLHNRPTLALFYDDYFKWELLGITASRPVLPSPASGRDSAGEAVELRAADRLRLGGRRHAQPLRLRDHHAAPPLRASRRPTSTWWASRARTRSGSAWAPRSRERAGRVRSAGRRPRLPQADRAAAVASSRARPGSGRRRCPRPPVAPLVPGGSTQVALNLPAGQWDVSLPYRQPAGGDRAGRGPERAHAPQP